MSSLVPLLQTESTRRRSMKRAVVLAFATMILLYAFVIVKQFLAGKPVNDLLVYIAVYVAMFGAGIGYTPRHRQALQAAIDDPDPALDEHFAECLVAEGQGVAELGRQAFVQRFRERLPQLDEKGWDHVGWGLKDAPTEVAERLLRLMAQGAPASAIERVDDLLRQTKVDRLRTAAHQTLGEIRLRTAREVVLASSEMARQEHAAEVARLGL